MKWRTMNKKQKEDLVTALLEKGETYREVTKRAGVSHRILFLFFFRNM